MSYLRFFVYAFEGISYTVRFHKSFKIQLVAALFATFLGLFFGISRLEWIVLVIAMGSVLLAELFNTTVESILDYMEKKHDLNVKVAKDVAAGGVLVTACVSILVGVLIFFPYIV